MPTVYVVRKTPENDYSDAKRFGSLVYLSEGFFNSRDTHGIIRTITSGLADSCAEDYLLTCGMPLMSHIAVSYMIFRHQQVNLLLFRDFRYIESKIDFQSFLSSSSSGFSKQHPPRK
jgi:hypothetical protein